jgi:hypothetical protein
VRAALVVVVAVGVAAAIAARRRRTLGYVGASLALVALAVASGEALDPVRAAPWAAACGLGVVAHSWPRGAVRQAVVAAAGASQAVAAVVVLAAVHRAGSDVEPAFALGIRAIGVVAAGAAVLAESRRAWIAPLLVGLGCVGACAATLGVRGVGPAGCLVVGVALGASLDDLGRAERARGGWAALAVMTIGVAAGAWLGNRSGAPQGSAVGVAMVSTGAMAAVSADACDERGRVLAATAGLAAVSLAVAFAVGVGLARCQAWIAREVLPSGDWPGAIARCDAAGTGWLRPDPGVNAVGLGATAGVALVAAGCVLRFTRWDGARRALEIAPALGAAAAMVTHVVAADVVAAFVLAVTVTATCAALILARDRAGSSTAVAALSCAAVATALAPLAR